MTVIVTEYDKLQCAERELRLRERAYPRFVEQKKISAGRAELELEIMRAIVDDYRRRVEQQPASAGTTGAAVQQSQADFF